MVSHKFVLPKVVQDPCFSNLSNILGVLDKPTRLLPQRKVLAIQTVDDNLAYCLPIMQ